MSKKLLKIIDPKRFSFLLLFALLVLPDAVTAQSGLIKAMTFEEAEKIAVKSVRRASGIRVNKLELPPGITYEKFSRRLKNNEYLRNCLNSEVLKDFHEKGKLAGIKNQPVPAEKIKELEVQMDEKCYPLKRLRLTDTLAFLGITDEDGLAALRSYIVRNVEFGVQSVWRIDGIGAAQAYVMSGKQLEDFTTSKTVLDLAKHIQENAAVPALSYTDAETLVRNCRYKLIGTNPPPDINLAATRISTEITGNNVNVFKKCLDQDEFIHNFGKTDVSPGVPVVYRFGVRTIKIVDNEGDVKFYYLTQEFKDNFGSMMTNENYKKLIEELVKSARIPLSEKFTAAQIVINALLEIEVAEKNKRINERNAEKTLTKSAEPLEIAAVPREKHKNFHVSDLLDEIFQNACTAQERADREGKVSVGSTLGSICVEPAEVINKIRIESESGKYFVLDKSNNVLVKTKTVTLGGISDETTLAEVIEKVWNIIKK